MYHFILPNTVNSDKNYLIKMLLGWPRLSIFCAVFPPIEIISHFLPDTTEALKRFWRGRGPPCDSCEERCFFSSIFCLWTRAQFHLLMMCKRNNLGDGERKLKIDTENLSSCSNYSNYRQDGHHAIRTISNQWGWLRITITRDVTVTFSDAFSTPKLLIVLCC